MLRRIVSTNLIGHPLVGPRAFLSMVLLCGLAALVCAPPALATGPVCRVTTSGSSGADGSGWAQAMALQTALGTGACAEIWVAQGIYTPTAAASPTYGDRAISFNVHPRVAVYGGFAGTESQRIQRDPAANPTMLSGDIDGDNINTYNSFHVVSMDGTTSAGTITASTVLDGFTIRDGFANSDVNYAGGLYCNGNGSGHECSPTLNDLTFSSNATNFIGGAMYNDGRNGGNSSPTLSNITFSGNSASISGGAMYNDGSSNGTSSPVLGNVTFSGNSANNYGGAMYNNGSTNGTSSPALGNVTFSGNSAGPAAGYGYGGAMFNDGGYGGTLGTSAPLLVNVIAWNDSAASAAEIYNYYHSTSSISYSIIGGGCPDGSQCTNLVSGDPKLGPLANNGGSTQTMAPAVGSSAIDAGNDGDCSLPPVNGVDQRGVLRPQGSHCDIGAVEYEDTIFSNGFELR